MKRTFALILACIRFTCVVAQQRGAGTVVIVGYDKYANRNMYGLLESERDGVINFHFFDDNVPCSIDRQANVLAGSEYLARAKPGKPILFIEIYERMKWIGNPETDIDNSLGVFMLVVTTGGDTVFANSEYASATKSFTIQAKPSLKRSTLQFTGRGYAVSYSENPKIPVGNSIRAIYVYPNRTRHYFVRKD